MLKGQFFGKIATKLANFGGKIPHFFGKLQKILALAGEKLWKSALYRKTWWLRPPPDDFGRLWRAITFNITNESRSFFADVWLGWRSFERYKRKSENVNSSRKRGKKRKFRTVFLRMAIIKDRGKICVKFLHTSVVDRPIVKRTKFFWKRRNPLVAISL